jgi:transcriptional regulator
MRAIVGIEVEVLELVGKFKLSQNKPTEDQASTIEGLRATGSPGALAMADAMAAG